MYVLTLGCVITANSDCLCQKSVPSHFETFFALLKEGEAVSDTPMVCI